MFTKITLSSKSWDDRGIHEHQDRDQTSFSGMDLSVNMYSWRIRSRVCALYLLLPLSQIIDRFGFSRCIVFIIHLDIYYI
jgi:hypothetical protein